jgi:hypothetical protein
VSPVNLKFELMRIAIVSDIHDNLTAFQAERADLREISPDLVLHGGDLVSGGSSPAEVVDLVRDLPPKLLVACRKSITKPDTRFDVSVVHVSACPQTRLKTYPF